MDEAGNVLSSASIEHEVSFPRPGWAEQDADGVWWMEFCQLSKQLLNQSGLNSNDIEAVSCSSMAPCLLPVDDRGRPLRSAILYGIDTRSVTQIEKLNSLLGEKQILERCGTPLSAQSIGPKILWIKENQPDIYRRTAKFLTATGYLVFKLTGRQVIDYFTASAGFAPIIDVNRMSWIDEYEELIVSPEKLPELAWTSEIAGYITPDASAECGLAANTPVTVGTGDAGAEALSVGAVTSGQTMLMFGSTFFIIEVVDQVKTDSRMWSAAYLFPGTYCMLGGMSATGAITQWFREQFARTESTEERRGGANAYKVLADEAATIPPGSEGLLVVPYFSGERTPINDPLARGLILGLSLSHTRAHIYRAILEATAYGVRHHLEVMNELGNEPTEILSVGGGTKNGLWLQIVSDVTGYRQIVPRVTYGAAFGDCFLAALGAGIYSDFRMIDTWISKQSTVEPNLSHRSMYDRRYEQFREAYETSKSLIHSLARS